MNIERIDLQRFRVGFRIPFASAHGMDHSREGCLIRMQTDDGLTGYGEASPLKAFGSGTLKSTEAHLKELARDLNGKPLSSVDLRLEQLAMVPDAGPACFAIDTAALDIESQQLGEPLATYLDLDATERVPLNATISVMDPERAAETASHATMAGYQAIKMKVGAISDRSDEIHRVAAVREAIGSNIELRLDVNGAWTYQQAVVMARLLAPYNISYLEQPIAPHLLGDLIRLQRVSAIPVAVDEAVTSKPAVVEIIQRVAADAIIIKPGVVGGIRRSQRLISLAHSAGMRVIVTTALETGLATAAAVHLAATLPSPVPPCGLATTGLLECDLLADSLQIQNGEMKRPNQPGLGVQLTESIRVGFETGTHPHWNATE